MSFVDSEVMNFLSVRQSKLKRMVHRPEREVSGGTDDGRTTGTDNHVSGSKRSEVLVG